MAHKYLTGDLAKLKSGGPWVTVTKHNPDQGSKFVQVSWFDASSFKTEVLPKDALEPKEIREAGKAPAAADAQG